MSEENLNRADAPEAEEPKIDVEKGYQAAAATLAMAIGEAAQAAGQFNVIAMLTRIARVECQFNALIDVLAQGAPEALIAYKLLAAQKMVELATKINERPRVQLASTLQ